MTASLTDLGPLFNYATAPHCGVDTSRDAAQSIKPQVNRLCSEVLHAIRASPFGATCDEIEGQLLMAHQTCSARFRDLAAAEPPYIIKCQQPDGSYLKRKTRSGRSAFVFVANQEVA